VDVIIQINGREAIPVRALPWMTHDFHFSAQDVADALSLSAKFPDFSGIHPFLIDGGIVSVDFWRNEIKGKIKRLEAQRLEPEQWQLDSLAALPAGVFVWRDEWASAYNSSPYGPDTLAALGDADDEKDIDERTLNFAPHIPLYLVQLVMEGFTQLSVQSVMSVDTASKQETATPGAVVTVGAFDSEAWVNKARERAAEIISRQRGKDLYPSQIHIADEIAREFRTTGVLGTDGKPLSGATIKRHALNGISSAQGKQLSTRTGRGK
jgi:hypothetical protein